MFCHSLAVIRTKQRYIDFLFFHEKVINMNFIIKWWRQAMNSKSRIYWSPIFLKITSAYQFWYKTAYSTPFRIQFFSQLTIILRNTFCHYTIKLCYLDYYIDHYYYSIWSLYLISMKFSLYEPFRILLYPEVQAPYFLLFSVSTQ